MDHYTAEKTLLERHAQMTRQAELTARLFPEPRPAARRWMAARLRRLADQLDGSGGPRSLSELTLP